MSSQRLLSHVSSRCSRTMGQTCVFIACTSHSPRFTAVACARRPLGSQLPETQNGLMMTSWHGNPFRIAGPLWGKLLLNKQSSCRWFEMPMLSLMWPPRDVNSTVWLRNQQPVTTLFHRLPCKHILGIYQMSSYFLLLSGEPDYFGRNKISSGGDLSHYSSASLY